MLNCTLKLMKIFGHAHIYMYIELRIIHERRNIMPTLETYDFSTRYVENRQKWPINSIRTLVWMLFKHTIRARRYLPVFRPCLSTGTTCWNPVSNSRSLFPRQTLCRTRCCTGLGSWWPSPRASLASSPPNTDDRRSISRPSDTTLRRFLPISVWNSFDFSWLGLLGYQPKCIVFLVTRTIIVYDILPPSKQCNVLGSYRNGRGRFYSFPGEKLSGGVLLKGHRRHKSVSAAKSPRMRVSVVTFRCEITLFTLILPLLLLLQRNTDAVRFVNVGETRAAAIRVGRPGGVRAAGAAKNEKRSKTAVFLLRAVPRGVPPGAEKIIRRYLTAGWDEDRVR